MPFEALAKKGHWARRITTVCQYLLLQITFAPVELRMARQPKELRGISSMSSA